MTKDFVNMAVELRRVFQFATVELMAKLTKDKASLSANDIEKTHYVIGMTTVHCVNLDEIINQDQRYFAVHKLTIEKFIVDAIDFATVLMEEGYGIEAVPA